MPETLLDAVAYVLFLAACAVVGNYLGFLAYLAYRYIRRRFFGHTEPPYVPPDVPRHVYPDMPNPHVMDADCLRGECRFRERAEIS